LKRGQEGYNREGEKSLKKNLQTRGGSGATEKAQSSVGQRRSRGVGRSGGVSCVKVNPAVRRKAS